MTAASQYKVFDAQFAAGINFKAIADIIGMRDSTVAEYCSMEMDDSKNLLDISGNGRTLTKTSTHYYYDSFLIDSNKLPVTLNTFNSGYYTRSTENWMNMFTGNFSMSFFVLTPPSAGSIRTLLAHGVKNSSGAVVYFDASGYPTVSLYKSGGEALARIVGNYCNSTYYVVHVNKVGNDFNIYVDNVAGTPGVSSSHGVDVAENLFLCAYKTPSEYWTGGFLYARLNTASISSDQRAMEIAYLKGLLAGRGGKQYLAPTFSRGSTSMACRTRLKQANALPVKVGTSYEAKKLYVEFDAKCLYTGTSDFGGVPLMFDIAGNTGTADLDTNRVGVYRSGATTYAVVWPNGESTSRYMSVAGVDLSQWHHYKFYFDFAELGNSTGYVDTTAFTNHGSLAGAKDVDLTNTRIRVGQNYADVTNGDCRTKNLRVRAAP